MKVLSAEHTDTFYLDSCNYSKYACWRWGEGSPAGGRPALFEAGWVVLWPHSGEVHLWPGSAQFDAFKLVMEKQITKAKSPTRGIRGGRGLRPTLRRDILASLSGSYYVDLTYSRCLYWLVKNSSKDSTEFTFSLLYLARYHGGTCVSGLVNLRSSQCYELSHRS